MLCCALVLAAIGCRKEADRPVAEYEVAGLQARAYNFQVYPGSTFLKEQTDILRRGSLKMHAYLTEAPPMAMYETGATIDEVAEFYRDKYGYARIAENEMNSFSAAKPNAYFSTGDLRADLESIRPLIDELKLKVEYGKVGGKYRGAYLAPKPGMPRVTLQRPFFDLVRNEVIDRTLIVLVREDLESTRPPAQ